MSKIFMEPEAIVRFPYTSNSFSRKTYEHILLEHREVIRKLTEYARCPLYGGTKTINKRLKCYITSGGNYKLYDAVNYNYKHKEAEIKKPKGVQPSYSDPTYYDYKRAEEEYYSWYRKITEQKYINSHLEEFDMTIDYYSSHRFEELIEPVKIIL